MKIQPFTSIGDIVLGSTMEDVTKLLGKSSSMEEEDLGDGLLTRTLEYEELGLGLTFSEDDNFLLGTISAESPDVTLEGEKIIGLGEEDFLSKVEALMGEKPELADDLEESGKDYILEKFDLSFWILDGEVASVTVFPKYDSSGEIPEWPRKG